MTTTPPTSWPWNWGARWWGSRFSRRARPRQARRPRAAAYADVLTAARALDPGGHYLRKSLRLGPAPSEALPARRRPLRRRHRGPLWRGRRRGSLRPRGPARVLLPEALADSVLIRWRCRASRRHRTHTGAWGGGGCSSCSSSVGRASPGPERDGVG